MKRGDLVTMNGYPELCIVTRISLGKVWLIEIETGLRSWTHICNLELVSKSENRT